MVAVINAPQSVLTWVLKQQVLGPPLSPEGACFLIEMLARRSRCAAKPLPALNIATEASTPELTLDS